MYLQIDTYYYYHSPDTGLVSKGDLHSLTPAIQRGLTSFIEDKHRPENRFFTSPVFLWEHFGLEEGTIYWIFYPGILSGGLPKSYTLAYKEFLGKNYFTGTRHDYR
jgi:hypothetical protein